jgi:hypothetical protein
LFLFIFRLTIASESPGFFTEFLWTLCYFLFGGRSVPVVENLPALRILVAGLHRLLSPAFSETSHPVHQANIIRCLSAIFQVVFDSNDTSGFALLQQMEPVGTLLTRFDSLTEQNQALMLRLLDQVWSRSPVPIKDLKTYCRILQVKQPLTLLMVFDHFESLLASNLVTSVDLREAGFLAVLNTYLCGPEELAATIQESDIAAAAERLAVPASEVVCTIILRLLSLSLYFLENDSSNQLAFRDSGGLKRLYQLLEDERLLTIALRILTALAQGKANLQARIIPEIVVVLQTSGGVTSLEPSVLAMRSAVLGSLSAMFRKNPDTKDSFRLGGGFTWSVAILDGVARCMETLRTTSPETASSPLVKSPSKTLFPVPLASEDVVPFTPFDDARQTIEAKIVRKTDSAQVFLFIKRLLDCLSLVLVDNPTNRTHFSQTLHHEALSGTLIACHFIEGSHAIPVVESLFNMALSSSWPPQCPLHGIDRPTGSTVDSEESGSMLWVSLLSRISLASRSNAEQALVSAIRGSCSRCESTQNYDPVDLFKTKRGLVIETPEIFKTLIELLPYARKEIATAILTMTGFVAEIAEGNVGALASVGIVGDVLSNFRQTLLISTPFQETLLNFVERIACVDISLPELRAYFKLFRDGTSFPVNLLSTLRRISERPNAPVYSVVCSENCHYVDLGLDWPLEVWPPAGGLTLSFWFCVRSGGYGRKMALTLLQMGAGQLMYDISWSNGRLVFGWVKKRIAFSSVAFEVGTWYHVALVYNSSRKPLKALQSNAVQLFVNGLSQCSDELPRANPLSNCKVLGYIGSERNSDNLGAYFEVGNVYAFKTVVTKKEAFQLYALGPSYAGGFRSSTFGKVYEHVTPENIDSQKDWDVLTKTPPLQALDSDIVFIFCARKSVTALPLGNVFTQLFRPVVASNSQGVARSGGGSTLGPTSAVPYQVKFSRTPAVDYDKTVRTPALPYQAKPDEPAEKVPFTRHILRTQKTVRYILPSIGGISTIIYLLASSKEKEHQREAMALLRTLLRFSSRVLLDLTARMSPRCRGSTATTSSPESCESPGGSWTSRL